MEYAERDPVPAVCLGCGEPDCGECDHAGLRWELPERDRLELSRRLKEKAIARYQREIMEINRRLKELEEARPL